MSTVLSKYIEKLFFKKWIIGIFRYDIKDLIRSKTFTPNINWLPIKSADTYYADPFVLNSKDEYLRILIEDFSFEQDYGKIALITLDKNFNQLKHKILLDTQSHISYPFIFTEDSKTYIFPEAGKSGRLSCYEYDPVHESIYFVKHLIDLPLCDSSILKQNGKYWIFGTLSDIDREKDIITDYKLCVFYSESLLGPYIPHKGNPVKSGLNGARQAGNFIEVDGVIYRPTQNCENQYGESISINKITEFNEHTVIEEPYMTMSMSKINRYIHGMHTIHTINAINDIIVVDGIKWTFSPLLQMKNFIKNRRNLRQLKEIK
jgi:hypothetical protein